MGRGEYVKDARLKKWGVWGGNMDPISALNENNLEVQVLNVKTCNEYSIGSEI